MNAVTAAKFRIYLTRPSVDVLLDWAFEKLPECRTLILWTAHPDQPDTYETYVVAERTEGQTMNLALDYLWDILKAEQAQTEAKYPETQLEYVE